ncbi:MAG TPA: MtrAB system histidine kinase MtrB [Actinomycetes bacterium]
MSSFGLTAFRARRATGRVLGRVGYGWRRSLHLRVVLTTLVLSATVVVLLGYLLLSRVTAGLLDAQQRSAIDEARAGLSYAQGQIDANDQIDPSSSGILLDQITQQLANRAGAPNSLYEVLLLGTPDLTSTVFQPEFASHYVSADSVPPKLRGVVSQSQEQAYTYTLIRYQDGRPPVPGFAVGAPLSVPGIGGYELYYLFPLTQEQDTLALVQKLLLVAGLALVLLLAAISWLVTRQVVTPVRVAARTAEQFSAGRLEERMTVHGDDDLARLATSFNQMASSLQRQIRQLEDLSRVQRRFVSDVSHELRTPLTTVRMAADILHEAREDFDPATSRSAELLQTQLDRFEALLTDLLEISRYDAGAAVLDVEPVDVREVVRRVVESAEPLAERKETEVRLDLPEDRCVVEADPRRVERVLRNLLVNAIEHAEGRPVDVRVAFDDQAVCVGVRDHGVGLRPGEASLVFNRFWRADPARARTTGGTGLGLAIALEDARLHGGWLEAWGQPGDGAHFRLTLPRRARGELISAPLPLEPADATAGRRVPLSVGGRPRRPDA